jgi:hypothetical protein
LEKLFSSTNLASGSNLGPSIRESGNVAVAKPEPLEEHEEPHREETVQGVDHKNRRSHVAIRPSSYFRLCPPLLVDV